MLATRNLFLSKKNLFRWGLRYYGFFDYNHAFIKSSFFNSASDVWIYGVGMDALYNFINDKNTNFLGKNNKLSVGLFGDFALAGTSWLNSQQVNLTMMNGIYNANVSASNFQFLFDLGLRMNLARPKKKNSDHTAQHGMELGFKIPTLTRIIILSWVLNSNTEGSIACISIMCLLTRCTQTLF